MRPHFFTRSRSNNFVDGSGGPEIREIRDLSEVAQGHSDVSRLGTPKRINLAHPSGELSGSSAAFPMHLGACRPQRQKTALPVSEDIEKTLRQGNGSEVAFGETKQTATSFATSSSSQYGRNIPPLLYIFGKPDLIPHQHFFTSLNAENIIAGVEQVFVEFKSTCYQWNPNHFVWKSLSTGYSLPLKASLHVYRDKVSETQRFAIELRRLQGDAMDFGELISAMEHALGHTSMAGDDTTGAALDDALLRAPNMTAPRIEKASAESLSATERKDELKNVVSMYNAKDVAMKRQHILHIISSEVAEGSTTCRLLELCDAGCVQTCMQELLLEKQVDMNCQLAMTALHLLTRAPQGADLVLNTGNDLSIFLKLACDQSYMRMQLARDSALVVYNLLQRSAERVVEQCGPALDTWFNTVESLRDQTLAMHIRGAAELCGFPRRTEESLSVGHGAVRVGAP